MRFYVGVTDNAWFDFIEKDGPDEVNFWRPSGREFSALESGEPFLFKLHKPLNFVVGGGFFIRSERLPLSLAWEVFGRKNGAATRRQFEQLIRNYRGYDEVDPEIGCIILNQPFFIPRDHWIPAPGDWKPNIVSGKRYDDQNEWSDRLWTLVRPWLPVPDSDEPSEESGTAIADPNLLYGQEYLRKSRLGQGAFRILVTDAYLKRCAISGERTLPVLQASHIKPYGEGPNHVDNGLLLRSDLHILFDRGYLTVTPDLKVEISGRIREEYENGKDYYRFHGNPLSVLPLVPHDRPNREFLRWHNERIFRST
ncbi:MAG: HNH endonuclease [Acidobacteria bacterium]|nr:HNH endonuclease [Acidobacteriota bacterium]